MTRVQTRRYIFLITLSLSLTAVACASRGDESLTSAPANGATADQAAPGTEGQDIFSFDAEFEYEVRNTADLLEFSQLVVLASPIGSERFLQETETGRVFVQEFGVETVVKAEPDFKASTIEVARWEPKVPAGSVLLSDSVQRVFRSHPHLLGLSNESYAEGMWTLIAGPLGVVEFAETGPAGEPVASVDPLTKTPLQRELAGLSLKGVTDELLTAG